MSSEAIRPDYAEAFDMDVARVHALGVPRTDVFFDTDLIARSAKLAATLKGDGERVRILRC